MSENSNEIGLDVETGNMSAPSSTQQLRSKIAVWEQVEQDHKNRQLINPFSEWEGASTRAKLSRDDPQYARPVEGSMTAVRGQAAGQRISGEIENLVDVIKSIGKKDEPDGRFCVTFGKLFDVYVKISNKLVGILLRARRQGLVEFDGEMLWQGKDDKVVITLVRTAL